MASWYIQRMRTVRAMNLPQAEKHALLVLATYGDKAGRAYPSAATLARDCGMSEKHIRTLLRKLRKRRAIVAVGRGPKGVTVYKVGTQEVGTHEDTTPPTHEVGSAPTHEVGTKGASEGATEGVPPMSPPPGGIQKLVDRMLHELELHGSDGWDPDDPHMVAHAAKVCSKDHNLSGRERWVERAMRLALAQYRGEA